MSILMECAEPDMGGILCPPLGESAKALMIAGKRQPEAAGCTAPASKSGIY